MRFEFADLAARGAPFPRPVIPAQVEDLEDAPQLCLIDTGAATNRFGRWLADAAGIDLRGAPAETIHVAGLVSTAVHARVDLTIAGIRYDAPMTFCDPWPFHFNLLGQEGFLRFFRLTICAAELWLDVEPEAN